MCTLCITHAFEPIFFGYILENINSICVLLLQLLQFGIDIAWSWIRISTALHHRALTISTKRFICLQILTKKVKFNWFHPYDMLKICHLFRYVRKWWIFFNFSWDTSRKYSYNGNEFEQKNTPFWMKVSQAIWDCVHRCKLFAIALKKRAIELWLKYVLFFVFLGNFKLFLFGLNHLQFIHISSILVMSLHFCFSFSLSVSFSLIQKFGHF